MRMVSSSFFMLNEITKFKTNDPIINEFMEVSTWSQDSLIKTFMILVMSTY